MAETCTFAAQFHIEMDDLYTRFGASSGKEEVHQAIANLDKGIAPGAFCKVLPDILGKDSRFLNVMHADGAGTKSILAYLFWKETGKTDIWKGIAQDALVMNLDDLLCVGATSDFVVTSTLGRNKRLIPGEIIKAIIEGTEEFCEEMRSLGIPMWFAGGETADLGDLVKTILVDSNISCRFPAQNLINASQIRPGDVILGLPSFGKNSYEKEYNSGIASNGITLARHILLHPEYAKDYPESIDSWFLESGGYSGKYRLTDSILQNHPDLGTGLLSPTRTFAPVLGEIIKQIPLQWISGLIHNTGGAHSKVKNFIGSVSVEKTICWEIPEIFRLIQKEAKIGDAELLKTFNCGIRMEIYCREEAVDPIQQLASVFGMEVLEIGRVLESANGPHVRIQSSGQEWMY